MIDNWLRKEVYNLEPYKVLDSEGFIKLDAMEFPYDVSIRLKQKYLSQIEKIALNRYPDITAKTLNKTIKMLFNISDNNDILFGNGSDELIQLLCLSCNTNDTIMGFSPSFVMYDLIAKFTQLQYQPIALDNNYQINLECSLKLIAKHKPKIIFIAYPNNPTGNLFNKQDIIKIITSANSLVVIDEAYYVYASDNFLLALDKYPNLIIIRTLSKLGLAGIRLGFLLANKNITKQLNKLRLPYNINSLTQVSAEFFLINSLQNRAQIKQIIASREDMIIDINKINGLIAFKSEANFILFKAQNGNKLFSYLLKNKVLIKNLSNHKCLNNHLRVSIGTTYENKIFINLLQNYANQ